MFSEPEEETQIELGDGLIGINAGPGPPGDVRDQDSWSLDLGPSFLTPTLLNMYLCHLRSIFALERKITSLNNLCCNFHVNGFRFKKLGPVGNGGAVVWLHFAGPAAIFARGVGRQSRAAIAGSTPFECRTVASSTRAWTSQQRSVLVLHCQKFWRGTLTHRISSFIKRAWISLRWTPASAWPTESLSWPWPRLAQLCIFRTTI